MPDTISVTLHFNQKKTYVGEFKPLQIVHEALHALLPHEETTRQRVAVRADNDDMIYADMFLGEVYHHYGHCELYVTTTPLQPSNQAWRQVGFDHLALSVQDRNKARDFFHKGLQMQIIRDDEHITVLTTGNTALFFFDAEPGKPLTDGVPSRIHHIGFVVDDMDAAYTHLQQHFPEFGSDFTVLERVERWSMYGRVQIGDMTFMIQLSEIKEGYKGFENPSAFADIMYDYSTRSYGVRFERG